MLFDSVIGSPNGRLTNSDLLLSKACQTLRETLSDELAIELAQFPLETAWYLLADIVSLSGDSVLKIFCSSRIASLAIYVFVSVFSFANHMLQLQII